MKEDAKTLEEVVVIGYGVVKKRDLTGSSVSVTGADLAEVPVTNAAQALAGKAAGVNIVNVPSPATGIVGILLLSACLLPAV